MKRFLGIVLALLIPLQPAVGALTPVAGTHESGCEPELMLIGHQNVSTAPVDSQSDCLYGNVPVGAHHMPGGHVCPHLGMTGIAATPFTLQPFKSANVLPEPAHTTFTSIVLDVPSPPPTRPV